MEGSSSTTDEESSAAWEPNYVAAGNALFHAFREMTMNAGLYDLGSEGDQINLEQPTLATDDEGEKDLELTTLATERTTKDETFHLEDENLKAKFTVDGIDLEIFKIQESFPELHEYCRNLLHDPSDELEFKRLEDRVLCYLVGRVCRDHLRARILDPTWVQPLCSGLATNSSRGVHMWIDFMDVGLPPIVVGAFGDVMDVNGWPPKVDAFGYRIAESLQHFASFLGQRRLCTPSLRLNHLAISSNAALPKDVFDKNIAKAIRTNCLYSLDIRLVYTPSSGDSKEDGWEIANALQENRGLKHLSIRAIPRVVESLVQRAAANRALKRLTLMFDDEFSFASCNLGGLLACDGLLSLGLIDDPRYDVYKGDSSARPKYWLELVKALKSNTTLGTLDIGQSRGWQDPQVVEALLEVLRLHCTQIIDLGLGRLVQDNNTLNGSLSALDEQVRLNSLYGAEMKRQPRCAPRSARIILCGPAYAGKTTICRTMLGLAGMRSRIHTYLQRRPKLWRFLYGPDADKELDRRTRGVEMYRLSDKLDLRISMWDFAGQKEYYALHEYMFPNANSANLFLFTFSLVANPFEPKSRHPGMQDRVDSIRKELLFWLRFLCSNSNKFLNVRPRVIIVFTNKDRVTHSAHYEAQLTGVVDDFKMQFKTRLDLVRPIILLNAYSEVEVGTLKTRILEEFMEMQQRLEETFEVCEAARLRFTGRRRRPELLRSKWGKQELLSAIGCGRGDIRTTSIFTLDEFDKICENNLRIIHHKTRHAVASYLHNTGEIIYFRDIKFIVTDPRWLGVEILGNLLDAFGRGQSISPKGVIGRLQNWRKSSHSTKIFLENGFAQLEELRTLVRNSLKLLKLGHGIRPDDIVQLLCALQICYEDNSPDRKGYLIPAALDDNEELASRGLRRLQWRDIGSHQPQISKFMGRRVQCADQDLTTLTPGFFPRLQVVLRNHFVEQKFIGEGHGYFEVDRNLLRFVYNAMDIIVEYGEGDQYRGNFVDVLVKTLNDHDRTVNFIRGHILETITMFCARPEGNQGVTLVEAIIRPECVEQLVLCKFRENQAKLVSDLERELEKDANHRFFWEAVIDHEGDPSDLGRVFVYAIDALKGEGFHDRCIQENIPAVAGILDSLHQEQLLPDTPKLLYISEENPSITLPDELRARLHLLCEWTSCPHVVKDQPGRMFRFEGEWRTRWQPLLDWSYYLFKQSGLVVAKTVPFFGGLEVGINNMPPQVSKTRAAFFDKKAMEEIVPQGRSKREEILRSYEKILKSSGPSCEWLTKFLDVSGHEDRFRKDFRLKKVKFKASNKIAFLCDQHCNEGFKLRTLVMA